MSFGASIIQFALRGDTKERWLQFHPVLADRELVLETDTDQFKIGDGVTEYPDLPYGGIVGPAGPVSPAPTIIGTLPVITGDPQVTLTAAFPSVQRSEGVLDISNRNFWAYSGTAWINAGQLSGPQGIQGEVGPIGATGPAGVSGEVGAGSLVPGPTGPSGAAGEAGPTGPEGPQGPVSMEPGPTGPQGVTGADSTVMGPTGPQGVMGPTGPQGADGAAGTIGVDGVTGPQGLQGPQGDIGSQGPQGIQGESGVGGTVGTQGVAATIAVGTTTTGAAGSNPVVVNSGTSSAAVFDFTIPQGPTGPAGIDGAAITGPTGSAGADSTVQGPAGPTGPAGAMGQGLAAGGTTGQALVKASAADYATAWADVVTPTGAQTLSGKTLEAVTLTNGYTEEVYALTGTAPVLNPANGSIQTWTLTGASTPTSAINSGQSLTLMINRSTSFSITWPSVTWKTSAGVAPTLLNTGFTAVQLWKVDAVLYGARVGDN